MSPATSRRAVRTVAGSAVVFSALYLLSDVIEAVQDGFSTGQLWLTLVAEAALPAVVIGLAFVQRPALGRIGWIGAGAYAYAYVFFTFTVVYALVEATPDYDALTDALGPWMTVHGAIMVVAGLAFGVGVVRAGVLPRWTGIALMVGVVAVAATQGGSEPVQVVAAAIRDVAFAGMGVGLLLGSAPRRAAAGAGGSAAPTVGG